MANTQKKNSLTLKQALTSVRDRLSAKPTSAVDKLFGRPIQKAPSGQAPVDKLFGRPIKKAPSGQAPTAMAKGGVARKTKKSPKKG
jgi:hypothetical protein